MPEPSRRRPPPPPGRAPCSPRPPTSSRRHVGPSEAEIAEMLKTLGLASLDALVGETVPAGIRLGRALALPAPLSEEQALAELRRKAAKNRVFRSFIGMGYHDCHTPAVVLRNVLENPGWYTQYTPYQAEIAQGRLEALLNFQTMVADLTGLPLANASLLDEATAAGEAMTLCHAVAKPGPGRLLRGRGLPPADDRGRAHEGGAARHPGPRGPGRRRSTSRARSSSASSSSTRPRTASSATSRASPSAPTPRARSSWWRRTSSPSPSSARRASSGRTWRSARRSASACRWATAGRTPPSSPRGRSTSATCPGGWWASRRTPRAGPPTAWRSRPASSTSAATRPRATSARRRCCSPSWPPCTRSTTARRACGRSRGACTPSRASSSWACGGSASTPGAGPSSTRCACAPSPEKGQAIVERARASGASTCARTPTARWASPSTRRRSPADLAALLEAFAGGAVAFTPEQLAERGRGRRSPRRTRARTRSSSTRSSTGTTPSTRCSAT